MKKLYYLIVVALLAVSCSTLNRAEKEVNTGNYDAAFDLLIKKYQRGISDKNYGKYLPTFQQAYLKMVEHEEDKIERLTMEGSPSNYGKIYATLLELDQRQTKLKALLPIEYNGKTYHFPTKNYVPALVDMKKKYIDYLIEEGDKMMAIHSTSSARKAYSYYTKVKDLNPSFPQISHRINDAHYKGTEFVLIEFQNRTQQLIPQRLKQELTSIDTYNLDNFWTEFHDSRHENYDYDYLVQLDFEDIRVTPERQNVVVHHLEKQIVDGWTYAYQNGQQLTDSLGEPIKIDNYITVRGRLEEVMLEKDAYMKGLVHITKVNNNQEVARKPVESNFAFRDRFAMYQGDRRALDGEFHALVNRPHSNFPSNEQMVYDMGEDIKKDVKRILKRVF